jgi:hypothetical protein
MQHLEQGRHRKPLASANTAEAKLRAAFECEYEQHRKLELASLPSAEQVARPFLDRAPLIINGTEFPSEVTRFARFAAALLRSAPTEIPSPPDADFRLSTGGLLCKWEDGGGKKQRTLRYAEPIADWITRREQLELVDAESVLDQSLAIHRFLGNTFREERRRALLPPVPADPRIVELGMACPLRIPLDRLLGPEALAAAKIPADGALSVVLTKTGVAVSPNTARLTPLLPYHDDLLTGLDKFLEHYRETQSSTIDKELSGKRYLLRKKIAEELSEMVKTAPVYYAAHINDKVEDVLRRIDARWHMDAVSAEVSFTLPEALAVEKFLDAAKDTLAPNMQELRRGGRFRSALEDGATALSRLKNEIRDDTLRLFSHKPSAEQDAAVGAIMRKFRFPLPDPNKETAPTRTMLYLSNRQIDALVEDFPRAYPLVLLANSKSLLGKFEDMDRLMEVFGSRVPQADAYLKGVLRTWGFSTEFTRGIVAQLNFAHAVVEFQRAINEERRPNLAPAQLEFLQRRFGKRIGAGSAESAAGGPVIDV